MIYVIAASALMISLGCFLWVINLSIEQLNQTLQEILHVLRGMRN